MEKHVRAWPVKDSLKLGLPLTHAEEQHRATLDKDERSRLPNNLTVASIERAGWFRNRVTLRGVDYKVASEPSNQARATIARASEESLLIRRWSHKLRVGQSVSVVHLRELRGIMSLISPSTTYIIASDMLSALRRYR